MEFLVVSIFLMYYWRVSNRAVGHGAITPVLIHEVVLQNDGHALPDRVPGVRSLGLR